MSEIIQLDQSTDPLFLTRRAIYQLEKMQVAQDPRALLEFKYELERIARNMCMFDGRTDAHEVDDHRFVPAKRLILPGLGKDHKG